MQAAYVATTPEEFHPADLEDPPEQFRKELQTPHAQPYTVVREEGNSSISKL